MFLFSCLVVVYLRGTAGFTLACVDGGQWHSYCPGQCSTGGQAFSSLSDSLPLYPGSSSAVYRTSHCASSCTPKGCLRRSRPPTRPAPPQVLPLGPAPLSIARLTARHRAPQKSISAGPDRRSQPPSSPAPPRVLSSVQFRRPSQPMHVVLRTQW